MSDINGILIFLHIAVFAAYTTVLRYQGYANYNIEYIGTSDINGILIFLYMAFFAVNKKSFKRL